MGALVCGADNGDDEFAEAHDNATDDKDGSTTELLDGVEGEGSAADIDDGGSDRDDEGVADSDLLEEGGAIVDCARSATDCRLGRG